MRLRGSPEARLCGADPTVDVERLGGEVWLRELAGSSTGRGSAEVGFGTRWGTLISGTRFERG